MVDFIDLFQGSKDFTMCMHNGSGDAIYNRCISAVRMAPPCMHGESIQGLFESSFEQGVVTVRVNLDLETLNVVVYKSPPTSDKLDAFSLAYQIDRYHIDENTIVFDEKVNTIKFDISNPLKHKFITFEIFKR